MLKQTIVILTVGFVCTLSWYPLVTGVFVSSLVEGRICQSHAACCNIFSSAAVRPSKYVCILTWQICLLVDMSDSDMIHADKHVLR